jgi:hypothetical protein
MRSAVNKIKEFLDKIKAYFRYLSKYIFYRMNEKEYKETVAVGSQVLKKIEDFFILKGNDHFGPNHFEKINDFSVKFFFSTKEYKLELDIDKKAVRWAKILLKVPKQGAEHTNSNPEFWVPLSKRIEFDKTGNITVDKKVGEEIMQVPFTTTTINVEELLNAIFD